MNNYEFIKEYNKNMKTIGQICREHKIDQSNLMRGKTNSHNQKIVADELKKQVIKSYSNIIIKEVIKDNGETNTL